MPTPATLYSTWQQPAANGKTAIYFIVIEVTIQDGQPNNLTLLNLNGNLQTKRVTVLAISDLISKQFIKPWLPL